MSPIDGKSSSVPATFTCICIHNHMCTRVCTHTHRAPNTFLVICAILKIDNRQGPLHIAHRTLSNVMWQPGWEGSLGEDGYMHMHSWVPS